LALEELKMNVQEYAVAKITNEIDGWYLQLDYYLTCNGGEPDTKMVDLCNDKIAELNEALNELYEAA